VGSLFFPVEELECLVGGERKEHGSSDGAHEGEHVWRGLGEGRSRLVITFETLLAVLVVYLALFLIKEHFEGGHHLPKLLLGLRMVVLVRMVAESHPAVSLLDVFAGRIPLDAQNLVVILTHCGEMVFSLFWLRWSSSGVAPCMECEAASRLVGAYVVMRVYIADSIR